MTRFLLATLMASLPLLGGSQPIADTLFSPAVNNPAYRPGEGPTISVDGAHNNFHTLQGGFRPFGSLLTRDGYVVKPLLDSFTGNGLAGTDILVIANALPGNRQNDSGAFMEEEIKVVNEWVREGGSILLIADHMPFPSAVEKLAGSFGVTFKNCFAMPRRDNGKDMFDARSGLQDCALTRGRSASEKVTTLQTFAGQAFAVPETAKPVILFDDRYEVLFPERPWEFNRTTPKASAAGLVQGAFFPYGKGRVVVFGEAAMFTAQVQGRTRVGMNAPSAKQNVQFVLNTIHWLDGLIE